MDKELITVEELAKILRISEWTAYNLVRKHKIPSIKIGRQIRIKRKDLEKLLEVGVGENGKI